MDRIAAMELTEKLPCGVVVNGRNGADDGWYGGRHERPRETHRPLGLIIASHTGVTAAENDQREVGELGGLNLFSGQAAPAAEKERGIGGVADVDDAMSREMQNAKILSSSKDIQCRIVA